MTVNPYRMGELCRAWQFSTLFPITALVAPDGTRYSPRPPLTTSPTPVRDGGTRMTTPEPTVPPAPTPDRPDPVQTARTIATRAHAGQLDKIGAPYIDHPAMVADLVIHLHGYTTLDPASQTATVCAAWLHDTVEDTDETPTTLTAAGIPPAAVHAVVALTRTDDVDSHTYYTHLRRDPVALLVKTADLAANLAPHRTRQVDPATRARLATKYAHALDVLGIERAVIDDLHRHL